MKFSNLFSSTPNLAADFTGPVQQSISPSSETANVSSGSASAMVMDLEWRLGFGAHGALLQLICRVFPAMLISFRMQSMTASLTSHSRCKIRGPTPDFNEGKYVKCGCEEFQIRKLLKWSRQMPHMYTPVRLLGKGVFSLVFEVKRMGLRKENSSYAFKRFFLQCGPAVKCAIRELRIFKRLISERIISPFLPKLYHCFTLHNSPIFVTNLSSGKDLGDILHNEGAINENEARFYLAEIICALEILHENQIVHLDLKPHNVLLLDSGHIMLTDFDRSLDLTVKSELRTKHNFGGTIQFMAPEIAKEIEITTMADIWSLGMLAAEMTAGPCRPNTIPDDLLTKWALNGVYLTENFRYLSKPLLELINRCLTIKFRMRPDISKIKGLTFFRGLNWEEASAGSLVPPRNPKEIESCEDFGINPQDPEVLQFANGENMPLMSMENLQVAPDADGALRIRIDLVDESSLKVHHIDSVKLEAILEDFEYIHPTFQKASTEEEKGTPPPKKRRREDS